MLVNGKWTENWKALQKADDKGRFVRQVSEFRNWITRMVARVLQEPGI